MVCLLFCLDDLNHQELDQYRVSPAERQAKSVVATATAAGGG